MRIRFSNEVMADTNSWRAMDRMVMHFEDGRHEWLADNSAEIMASLWIADSGRNGEANRKALQEHIRWAAYPKQRQEVTVMLTTSSATSLSPQDAIRAMETPLYVALENATADGGFLVTLLLALNRTGLWEAWEKRWIALDQMGGYGECEKAIVRLRENIPGPSRVFVLADSDAHFPGEYTATVRKVTESCQTLGATFAILAKRKIENYLPVSVLNRLNRRQVFQAFLNLTSDQRSHYEMKHGFATDDRGRVVVPPEQTALFAGVRGPILNDLCGGFGGHVADNFHGYRMQIAEADFRQVCDTNPYELDRILDQIEGLL
jgi:hypothetical protein